MRRFANRKSKKELVNQMNVVPYIDVMLVLLIIFMITAPMFIPGVINLPSVGKASHINKEPIQIVVNLNNSYQIKYNNDSINFSNINSMVSYLKNKVQGDGDLSIVISADKEIKYDNVIDVINKLYMANMRKVALVVKEK
jgi:biopolymer transport protein TolR